MKSKILLILMLVFFESCGSQKEDTGGGTTTGNPSINLKFSSFDALLVHQKILNHIGINVAHASVNSLHFCFKRLRFKASDSDVGEDIDAEIGRLEIDPAGTFLSNIKISEGTYRRIEFDLEKDCEGGSSHSVDLVTDQGTFTTDDSLTIKFEGEIKISKDGNLNMDVQTFIDALDTVNDGANIKDTLEALSGSF
jgi:hypothetical protein